MLIARVLALAIIFGVFAGFDWKRVPVLSRCSLAVATTFLIAAVVHPGAGVGELLSQPDGIGYLVAVARALGAATAVASLCLAARDAAWS
jgi:flagellar biosynthesis protein FliR